MLHDYTFRPLSRADYPMIRTWLSAPHIEGWWGTPEHEIELIEEEMGGGLTDVRIVQHDGTPFALIQDYRAHEWNAPHYADQPSDARAVDTFLGDPAFLGQGHAKAYISARAWALKTPVLVDPDTRNTRAIATYRAAGFRPIDTRPCEDGDPVLVMRFDPA